MKKAIYALSMLLMTGSAFGQTQQQPVVVTSATSSGANVTQPVGNGAGNSTPMPVTCASGCSGGSGGGAVFGPTAVGSAAANPPVLTAGTANATATGTVQVQKVDSSGNIYSVVTNAGTFAVQNTAVTPAGSNIIGKVGIDQTAPGTTNGVQVLSGSTTTVTQGTGTNLHTVIDSGNVTAGNPVGITPTDRTITSATGASQQMAAANAARHSLTIVNTGNANCGVNPTGGTAAIGGAGTLTLFPGGSYTPRIPTLSAVTVICTAAQPIYGDEN